MTDNFFGRSIYSFLDIFFSGGFVHFSGNFTIVPILNDKQRTGTYYPIINLILSKRNVSFTDQVSVIRGCKSNDSD